MVPILSLPQQWLWCQTWCSMEELPNAKTIDLCNNPLTKTPKLEVAKQLLPEWVGLDQEARDLEETIMAGRTAEPVNDSQQGQGQVEDYPHVNVDGSAGPSVTRKGTTKLKRHDEL